MQEQIEEVERPPSIESGSARRQHVQAMLRQQRLHRKVLQCEEETLYRQRGRESNAESRVDLPQFESPQHKPRAVMPHSMLNR